MNWSPRTSVSARIVFVAIFVIVIWAVFPTGRTGRTAGEMFFFDRQGGSVGTDSALQGLGSDYEVRGDVFLDVWCQNGLDWISDRAIDLDIRVLPLDGLVRAVELVADGRYSSSLVASVEKRLVSRRLNQPADEEWVRRSFAVDEVNQVLEYLADRGSEPSEAARGRFVVYAVSSTRFRQLIVGLDLDGVDREQFGIVARRRAPGFGYRAPVSDPVEFNSADCVSSS